MIASCSFLFLVVCPFLNLACVPTLYMVLVREQAMEVNHRLSDSHVKDDHSDGDLSGSLEDDVKVADKERRKKQSPTKRRKIEHESRLLFEVLLVWSSKTFSFHTYMQFAQNFKCCLLPTRAPILKIFRYL